MAILASPHGFGNDRDASMLETRIKMSISIPLLSSTTSKY